MKNLIIALSLSAFIICSISSCKKCFTCTVPTCGKCTYGSGSSSSSVCNTDQTAYNEAQVTCLSQAGTWTLISTANTWDYCDKPSNTANINNKEDACEASGGVWSNK
jgi:hypothetical protein